MILKLADEDLCEGVRLLLDRNDPPTPQLQPVLSRLTESLAKTRDVRSLVSDPPTFGF